MKRMKKAIGLQDEGFLRWKVLVKKKEDQLYRTLSGGLGRNGGVLVGSPEEYHPETGNGRHGP